MQGGVCGMCRAAGIPCELMVRQTNRRSKCGCLGEFLGSIYFRAAFEFLRSTLATEGKTSFEKKEAIHLGFFFWCLKLLIWERLSWGKLCSSLHRPLVVKPENSNLPRWGGFAPEQLTHTSHR